MAQASIYDQILDPASRANPYPLYAELRKTPVARQADDTYVVSTYHEIAALLHDPQVSSDPRSWPELGGAVRPSPHPTAPRSAILARYAGDWVVIERGRGGSAATTGKSAAEG
jgi:cytochrome P450